MTHTRLSGTARAPLTRVITRFPDRDSDPRFQYLFEQLPAAFVVLQETGVIVAANVKAAVLTGWARSDLISRPLAEFLMTRHGDAAATPEDGLGDLSLIHPGSQQQVLGLWLRARSGQPVLVDMRLSAFVEGDVLMVLALATPAEERLAQERVAFQQARAIAALERLLLLLDAPREEALGEAIQLAREMLGADAIGLYQTTANTAPRLSLRHADGVPALFPRTIEPDEAGFLMRPFTWTSDQRSEAFLRRGLRAAGWQYFLAHPIGEGQAFLGTLFIAYAPGNPPIAQAPGLLALAAQHIHYLIVRITLAAHTSSAQELTLQLSSRLAAINTQIEEGVVIVSAEGTIDEVNNAAAQLLGYRSQDITGLPFGDVLVFDDVLGESVKQARRGAQSGVFTREGHLHRRSGEPFPVRVRLRPLPDCGAVMILSDLSGVRTNEVQQENLDHLSYVGESAKSFAHEVRAPLNNISTGVQYLATKLPPDDAIQQHLNTIQVECQRLASLMNDLLAWAKPLNPQKEPFELAALLQRLITRWKSKITQQNVRLNVSIVEDCPPVLADPRLIERVFVNLIENALQAMPTGGHLSVDLKTVDRGLQGRFIETRIFDSGPGIPEENRRRIFEPHFTTKTGGTGLGLAICKRLVTVHHGAIDVESFPGGGTIFIVTLPVYDPERTPA